MTGQLRVEIGDDHVAVLTLDRPEAKNALSIDLRDALVGAVRDCRADPDVRAVMITGVGDAFENRWVAIFDYRK